MDVPDADELEWMVQQEQAFEDDIPHDEGAHLPDFLPPDHRPGCKNSGMLLPSYDSSCKRLWPNSDAEHDKVSALQAPKRRKLCPQVILKNSQLKESHGSSVEDIMEESFPPPPFLATQAKAQQDGNENCREHLKSLFSDEDKLPVKRAADIQGEFISITAPSGERVYTQLKMLQTTSQRINDNHGYPRKPCNGLLSKPFGELLEQVEQEMIEKACCASREDSLEQPDDSKAEYEKGECEQLWVEKYAPKSFTELLSDEKTNREVLRWLKQWDRCVFGEKKNSTSIEVLESLRRQMPVFSGRTSLASSMSFEKGKGAIRSDIHNENGRGNDFPQNVSNNPDGKKPFIDKSKKGELSNDRPEEKILLLCGPPGLGKTTLAHVAARHCGYRVVEINASDDRVATTLQAKILDAVQMKSIMGDSKPNCLVIDEIDGALGGTEGKSAIDALLNIVLAETKHSNGKEDALDGMQTKKTSKKKGASVSRLSRPVICICNDLYAPALRSLRQTARVHAFERPSATRVVTRLKYICNMEGYKTNARALTALADYTECDIRSCLNTLQFLNKKKEPLKMLDIASQVVGRKDMTSSIFDIWREIFQKRKEKHGTAIREGVKFSANCVEENKEFIRVHELIANHGDFELTVEGIYENLLHMQYHDSMLQKTVECLELIGDSEIINHHVLRNQQFALIGYLPSKVVAIRHLISQPGRPNIEWPRMGQRYRVDFTGKKELLRSWMNSMQPIISRGLSAGCLALDVVSLLMHILSPQTLRPVAPQLLSQCEREEISQLVDTMIEYGITYKHAKPIALSVDKRGLSTETHELNWEPPIHMLASFKDHMPGYKFLSLTLRQVLSHEVEIETIRRENTTRSARAMAAAAELDALTISDMGCKESCREKKLAGSKMDSSFILPRKDADNSNGFGASLKHFQFAEIHEGLKRDDNHLPGSYEMASIAKQVKPRISGKQATNFFDRFKKTSQGVVGSDRNTKTEDETIQRDSRPLLYKYHEGFTNAIRRPVLIQDFL